MNINTQRQALKKKILRQYLYKHITSYQKIKSTLKKKGISTIDKQFEYNTYIRDFFSENQGKSLEEAFQCWKYKKRIKGHNRYEHSDVEAIENEKLSCRDKLQE